MPLNFCCELHKGFIERYTAIVEKDAKKAPLSLTPMYIKYITGMSTYCPACLSRLDGTTQSDKESATSGPKADKRGLTLDVSSIPKITKEQYKGELPFDRIPESVLICPFCAGSGREGTGQAGIPIACSTCTGQGQLVTDRDKRIAIVKLRSVGPPSSVNTASLLKELNGPDQTLKQE